MADAYTSVVQGTLTKKAQEQQWKEEARENMNDMWNTVGSLVQTGAELGQKAFISHQEEYLTSLQNSYNEMEAKGAFDHVDYNDLESEIEYDPDKTIESRKKWMSDWISDNVKSGLMAKNITKSANSFLDGQKATIISNKSASNYNSLQNDFTKSLNRLTSVFFDDSNTDTNISSAISLGFGDLGYSTTKDVYNVEDLGIGKLALAYDEAEVGSEEKSALGFELQYALNAYNRGQSQYYYDEYKKANYESDYLKYRIAQGTRAGMSELANIYMSTPGDEDARTAAVSAYINEWTTSLYNKGLQVGEKTRLSYADMGDYGISYATECANNYKSLVLAQVGKEQSDALTTANNAFKEEYGSSTFIPWKTEDELVDYLVEKSDNKLSREYAKSSISDSMKTLIANNKKNYEVGTLLGIMNDSDATLEQREGAINTIIAKNYLPLFTSDNGFGFGILSDTTDDKTNAPGRVAIEKVVKETGLSYGDAAIRVYGTSSASNDVSAANMPDLIQAEYNALNYNAKAHYEDVEDVILSTLVNGEPTEEDLTKGTFKSIEGVLEEYGLTWDEYPSLKTAYDKIKDDKVLKAYISSGKTDDDKKALAKEILYLSVASNGTSSSSSTSSSDSTGSSGTGLTKSEAATLIESKRSNLAYDANYGQINLGCMIANKKESFTNPNGYEESVIDMTIMSTLMGLAGDSAVETDENVTALLEQYKAAGMYGTDEDGNPIADVYGLEAFEKKWQSLSLSGKLENMTKSEFLNTISALKDAESDYALNCYYSFEGDYNSKADCTLSGYSGQTIKEVMKAEGVKANAAYSDYYLTNKYANRELKFGQSDGKYTLSPNALAEGDVGSDRYNNYLVRMVHAKTPAEREKLLENAEYELTSTAVAKLKETNSINILVSGIPNYENFDFLAAVRSASYQSSSFSQVSEFKDPSDWVDYVANDENIKDKVSALVAAYNETKDINAFNAGMNELIQKSVTGYAMYGTDSGYQDAVGKYNVYVGDEEEQSTFNIINDVSKKSLSDAEFWDNVTRTHEKVNAKTNNDDIQTLILAKNFLDGRAGTSTSLALSGSLQDPNIDEKLAMPLSYLHALDIMGRDPGVTEQDLRDNWDAASSTLRAYLSDLDESNSLTVNNLASFLDETYTKVRGYNALGYNYDYTIDLNGNLIIKDKGTVTKNAISGDYILTDADGKQTNMTMYSNHVKLENRGSYVVGDNYETEGIWKGNKITSSKETLLTTDGLNQIKSYNTEKSSINTVTDYSKATENVGHLDGGINMSAVGATTRNLIDKNAGKRAIYEELTGEEITNRYMDCLTNGDTEGAAMIIAQLSDGMSSYVTSSSDEILAGIALANFMTSGKNVLDDTGLLEGLDPEKPMITAQIAQKAVDIALDVSKDIGTTIGGTVTLNANIVANSNAIGRTLSAGINALRSKRVLAAHIEGGSSYYYDGELKKACEEALVRYMAKYSKTSSSTPIVSMNSVQNVKGKNSQEAYSYEHKPNAPTKFQLELEEKKRKIFEASNK